MKTWRNITSLILIVLCLTAPATAAHRLRAPAPPRSPRAEPDPLTPANAEVVVSVNVRQVLQTPVVKKHALDPLKLLLTRNDELKQLLTAAGLDPFKDLDTIALSMSGNPTSTGNVFVVVRGSFDAAKVRTAADDYAKKHPGRLKSVQEGELPMWEITSNSKSFFAALAGKNALVMTTAKADTVAAVKRAGQRPERINKDMQAALDKLKGGESVWLAMIVTDQVRQVLKGDEAAKNFADALQSITGALELTGDAELALVIHTNDPTAATQIKAKLDEVMPLLSFLAPGKDKAGQIAKELIGNIKLAKEKSDVSIRLKVTDAQLEKAGKKDQ